MTLLTLLRYIWAGPNTGLGLLVAAIWCLVGGRIRIYRGVVEAEGPGLAWGLTHLIPMRGGAAAITFGHVVLARDPATLAQTRAHERVHVRQYERCGPLFIPLYVLASIWAAINGEHPYFDNVFEREVERAS